MHDNAFLEVKRTFGIAQDSSKTLPALGILLSQFNLLLLRSRCLPCFVLSIYSEYNQSKRLEEH